MKIVLSLIEKIGRQLAQWTGLMGVVTIGMFILFELSPIDPVQSYVRSQRMFLNAEQLSQLREQFGSHYAWWQRYVWWLTQTLQHGFGQSIVYKQSVWSLMLERMAVSFPLLALSWSLSGVLGYVLGVVSGIFPRHWFSKMWLRVCYVIMATPTFWIGLLFVYVFAVSFQWLPSAFSAPIGRLSQQVTWQQRLVHLILPTMTLTLSHLPTVVFYTHQKVQEAMQAEYMRFATLNGVDAISQRMRLLLPNTILPVVIVQLTSVGELLGGSLLVEQVFAYPGLGKMTVEAGLAEDVPLIMGIVVVMATMVFIGNQLIHIVMRCIDSRLKGASYGTI